MKIIKKTNRWNMKIPKKEMVCTLNGTGKIVVNQVEYQFDADCEMAMNRRRILNERKRLIY